MLDPRCVLSPIDFSEDSLEAFEMAQDFGLASPVAQRAALLVADLHSAAAVAFRAIETPRFSVMVSALGSDSRPCDGSTVTFTRRAFTSTTAEGLIYRTS
jgi:hypothetical protein